MTNMSTSSTSRCIICGSHRVAIVRGKLSDVMVGIAGNRGRNVPHGWNLGDAYDKIDFGLCLECGQIQGHFPVEKGAFELGSTTTCASVPTTSKSCDPPLTRWERLLYRIQDALVPIEVWLHRRGIITSDWVDWEPCKDCRDLGETIPTNGFWEPM